jgi:molybdopterin-binding protein
MSQVTTTYLYKAKVGETISSANANNLYSNINTASTTINETNTRTESISRRHLFDLSDLPLNQHVTFGFIQDVNQYLSSGNYNSSVYVDITHGVLCSLTAPAPFTLRPNEAIRLQFSVNVEAAVKGTDVGFDLALETNNYYFRFFVNINGLLTAVSPEYGYSLLADAEPTQSGYAPSQTENNASFSDIANSDLIVQVRVAQSYIYINKTNSDQTITIMKPRVRVQVPQGAATTNTITLKEFEFVSMGVR